MPKLFSLSRLSPRTIGRGLVAASLLASSGAALASEVAASYIFVSAHVEGKTEKKHVQILVDGESPVNAEGILQWPEVRLRADLKEFSSVNDLVEYARSYYCNDALLTGRRFFAYTLLGEPIVSFDGGSPKVDHVAISYFHTGDSGTTVDTIQCL